ncbi:glycoside hydrolase domain-containing protein [Streptomyces cyaneus]|uniref:glycoside hydrolase domain-containing protein n=1 Tax=Streptomyces cyaneus TaxID=1904 RepID=UPI000FF89483|nr:glycoside hydrolase domain-containing protein [Streptomyces cyaneus]
MSDPNVLAAQRWVNDTYAGVAGYIACDEDGATGWGTVLSLTQGLQHELGISPTVQNFGPGTFTKVKERNLRPFAETNKNIVRIYNATLWCKGYYGSATADTWDSTAQASMTELYGDIGIPAGRPVDAELWARVTKALLRMDQFRRVPEGEAAIQSIQRYLNSRYVVDIRIPAMNIVPCDGVYSRDVQQGLMMAIQYEIGIARDEITGYFGDKTIAGLKSNPYTPGDDGPLAILFRAACRFNSPTYDEDYGEYHYSSSFDAAAEGEWIRAFKRFSLLQPVNAEGDYQTWAQLLVSMGDPMRAAKGCDGITTITPERGKALYGKGYRLVGRYLDEKFGPGDDGWLDKAIKPGELKAIFDSGLRVFPISQYYGGEASEFTFARGEEDAEKAYTKARGHGFNRGTCIYFAVDYDATGTEINSHIIPYFKGVRSALAQRGNYYQFGVYGSRNVCDQVSRNTGARWSFVSGMSWGFSGNLGYPLPRNWSINQIREYDFDGDGVRDLDHDVWRETTDSGSASVNSAAVGLDQFVVGLQKLEAAADFYDDPQGKSRNQLVLEFFRYGIYDSLAWNVLLDPIDEKWIKHVKARDISVRDFLEFTDPVTQATLGTQHLMASTEGIAEYASNTSEANFGDTVGWGGDLMTFYAEWRKNRNAYPTGLAFCQDRLARPDVDSTFGYGDFLEDADAFNLGLRIRSGQRISQAVSDYYSRASIGGDVNAPHRFRAFYVNRFGADSANIERLAKAVLVGDDLLESGANLWQLDGLLEDTDQLPTSIPASELNSFLLGFRWALTDRVEAEGGSL